MPKVNIACFGNLNITLEGKNKVIAIGSRKTEELIAYLLCSGGVFVSKQKIAAALWNKFTAERAMDNFYKTLKRLYCLGFFSIENLRGKIRLNMENICCDVFTFEELYAKRREIDQCEAAVALYRGPLLFDECYDWISIWEAYYDIRYQELLNRLIMYYKKQGDFAKVAYYTGIMDQEL